MERGPRKDANSEKIYFKSPTTCPESELCSPAPAVAKRAKRFTCVALPYRLFISQVRKWRLGESCNLLKVMKL